MQERQTVQANALPPQTDPLLAAAVRRAAVRLIPCLLLMYVLAYLDRANLGFAKQAFQADRGISEAAYAFGAGILSIGYAAFEIPSNLALAKFGARRWLARIMITWGLVAAAMIFVAGNTSFFSIRFVLGVAEAGFFPGAVYYMTFWFPNQYRSRVMGLFYLGAPFAFIFGGPLSGALLDLDGAMGLAGWQWMFLVDGLAASVVGVFVFFWLPDRPSEAKWLPADERAALERVCGAEERGRLSHGPRGLLRALTSWRVLYLAAIYFLIQVCVNGVVYYLPAQVGQLLGRRVGLTVALVTAVPYLCAAVAALTVPRLAEITGRRRLVAALTMAVVAVGVAVSAKAGPGLALAGLCVAVAGFISVQPIFWSFPTAYLGGMAAAGGLALVNSLGALSGFVAPQARVLADGLFGPGGGLLMLAVAALIGTAMILALVFVAPSPATQDQRSG
jgi:sugar phosphate permease